MTLLGSLTTSRPEFTFWQFGICSVLLHIGALSIVGSLYASHHTAPQSVMTVTLLSPSEQIVETPRDIPPMLRTKRTTPKPLTPPPPKPLTPPRQTVTVADIPQPTTQPDVQPVERKTIQDETVSTASVQPLTPMATTPRRVMSSKPTTLSQSRVRAAHIVDPIYPAAARRAGWEGTVVVRVTVQPDGRPGHLTVQQSSGHTVLDDVAVSTLKQWTFDPEKNGNIPVSSIVDIPIRFDLRK